MMVKGVKAREDKETPSSFAILAAKDIITKLF